MVSATSDLQARQGSGLPFGVSPKVLVAGTAVVLAVAYLVLMGLQSSTVYFLTVSELQAKGAAAQSQVYRVSGQLVPGTLVREDSGLGIRFLISDAAVPTQTLPVVYRGGQIPDIVGDDVEIVAEGKLDEHGSFTANTLLAKCPSRLENAPPEEHDYSSGTQLSFWNSRKPETQQVTATA